MLSKKISSTQINNFMHYKQKDQQPINIKWLVYYVKQILSQILHRSFKESNAICVQTQKKFVLCLQGVYNLFLLLFQQTLLRQAVHLVDFTKGRCLYLLVLIKTKTLNSASIVQKNIQCFNFHKIIAFYYLIVYRG